MTTERHPARSSALSSVALDQRLRLIEQCGECCGQMLAAARHGDWREVRRLEPYRRQLVAQLRFEDLPAEQAPLLLEPMRRLIDQADRLDALARAERDHRRRALSQSRQSAGAIHAYVNEQHGLPASRGPGR